jgi:uncharacterized membrane protein YcaP (DUF421 family)
MFRSPSFKSFMEEDPVMLIKDGVVDEKALNKVK